MIGPVTKRPTGSDPAAKFMQSQWDSMMSNRIQSTSGARINRTARGFSIIPESGGGTAVSVRMLKLHQVESDYLVCHSWDGETEGETPIYVAKQYKHRNSLESEDVYGDTHSYTYAEDTDEPEPEEEDDHRLNVIRTVDDGTDTEDQRIVPPWLRGDIIYAISARTGAVVPAEDLDPEAEEDDPDTVINFLHMGEARQWARVFGE